MSWSIASGPWSAGPLDELTKLVTWKLSAKQSDPSSISFDVDGTMIAALGLQESLTDFWLFSAGQVVTRGRFCQTTESFDDADKLTVSAPDYRGVLDRRIIWDSWTLARTNVDPIEDAWQLIAQAQAEPGGSYGIVRGALPTDTQPVATISQTAGSSVASGIVADSKLAPGFDWDITPVGETGLRGDFWRNGRGRVTDVKLEYASGSLQRQTDTAAYANSVRLPGGTNSAGAALPAIRRDAPDIATRPEGRWELAVQDNSTFTSTAAAGARADYELAHAVLQPSYTFTLADGLWDGPQDFWVGDTVTLQLRAGRLLIEEPLPVVQIDATGDADRSFPKVTVTLGSYTFEQQQRLRLRTINRALGALQRR